MNATSEGGSRRRRSPSSVSVPLISTTIHLTPTEHGELHRMTKTLGLGKMHHTVALGLRMLRDAVDTEGAEVILDDYLIDGKLERQ